MAQMIFLIFEEKSIYHREMFRIAFFKEKEQIRYLVRLQPKLSVGKDIFGHWTLSAWPIMEKCLIYNNSNSTKSNY